MLDKQIDEIVMEGGAVVGVRSGTEVAKCKQVYCDPSYATGNVKKTGRVVRCICLLDHPIPNTKDALSTQLILPQKQRKATLPSVLKFEERVINILNLGRFLNYGSLLHRKALHKERSLIQFVALNVSFQQVY